MTLATWWHLARLAGFALAWRMDWLPHGTRGRRLAAMLTEMGVLWVKIGQVLSVHYRLFEADELRDLRSNVRPDHAEDLTYLKDRGIAFEDEAPFASGCVASVFRGRVADGTAVAVKIVRRDAWREFDDASSFLGVASALAPWVPGLRRLNVPAFAETLLEVMRHQVDMVHELANWRLMHDAYAGGRLVVPFVHEALCDDRTMVMDYVEGVDIDGLRAIVAARPHVMQQVSRDLTRFMFESTLIDRVFHADVHPGNIFWHGESLRLGMYDYGIVRQMPEQLAMRVLRFYMHLFFGELDETCDAFVQLVCPGRGNPAIAARIRDAFVARTHDLRGISLVKIVQDVISLSGTPLNHDLSLVNLNIITINTVLDSLQEGFDAIAEMKQCLRDAVVDGRIDIARVMGP